MGRFRAPGATKTSCWQQKEVSSVRERVPESIFLASGFVNLLVEDGSGSYQDANEYPEEWDEQGEEAEEDDLESWRR